MASSEIAPTIEDLRQVASNIQHLTEGSFEPKITQLDDFLKLLVDGKNDFRGTDIKIELPDTCDIANRKATLEKIYGSLQYLDAPSLQEAVNNVRDAYETSMKKKTGNDNWTAPMAEFEMVTGKKASTPFAAARNTWTNYIVDKTPLKP